MMVTYTCTINRAGEISWTAAPIFTTPTLVRFLSTTPSDQRMLNCSYVPAIDCAEIDFQAALITVGSPDGNGAADLTSTFSFTATPQLNGTVVACRGETTTGPEILRETLIVESMYIAKHSTVYCRIYSHIHIFKVYC